MQEIARKSEIKIKSRKMSLSSYQSENHIKHGRQSHKSFNNKSEHEILKSRNTDIKSYQEIEQNTSIGYDSNNNLGHNYRSKSQG